MDGADATRTPASLFVHLSYRPARCNYVCTITIRTCWSLYQPCSRNNGSSLGYPIHIDYRQILSYGLLFGWKDDWSKETAIVYVTIAQMFAGIAKDLTKLGGKTVTKLVTPEGKDTRLFHLVSLLTGWKNSLKGVGYFLGSALLEVSYELALSVMIGLIVIAMPFAIFGLDKNLGTAKNKNASLKDIFVLKNFNLNVLSLARLFLFASRDFWFEVPVSSS